MLGKHVRWIDLSRNLPEVNPSATDCLLYPKQMRVDVAELPQPLSAADAYGG
jgi:hypothetical protein